MASGTIKKLLVGLGLDAKGYTDGLDAAERKAAGSAGKITSTLSKIGGSIVLGGIAAVGAAVTATSAFLASSIPAASDLAETVSKVGIVFGESSETIMAMGNTAAASMGMSQNAALAAAATYGNLFRSMGMAESTSADMSGSLVQLASDLASFNNMDPTMVLDKLRAGLTGETEPLKTLGVNLSAVSIEARAMEMGFRKVNGVLPASAKAQASYSLIMEQTALAQGDFARTSEGLANQQRIQAAVTENLRASMGRLLLPFKTKLVSAMTKRLVPLSEQFNKLGDVVEANGGNFSALFAQFEDGSTYFDGLFTAIGFSEPVAKALGNAVAWLGTTLTTWLPQAFAWLNNVFNTIINNRGLLIAALAMIGAAIAVFVWVTVIPALIAFLTAALPVILIMAAIGLAAYLLYQAWTTNFGGIQQIVAMIWEAIRPIFEQLWGWLQNNIPLALAWLSNVWQTVLLPAIQAVGTWMQTVLIPLLAELILWLQTNIPLALQALSTFWTGTLLPAITTVYNWIQSNVMPLFRAMRLLVGTLLVLAFEGLSNLWTGVVLPALEKLWGFIQDKIMPIFREVADFVGPVLSAAFDALADAIAWVTTKIVSMVEHLQSIASNIPPWLIPGSPTPLEIGLRGIGSAFEKLARYQMPEFEAGLKLSGAMSGITEAGSAGSAGGQVQINQNINTPIDYQVALRQQSWILAERRR